MSETEPLMVLHFGEHKYDLTSVIKALQYTHDFAALEDMRNAVKNLATDVRPSPLVSLVEEALALLEEIRVRHGHLPEGPPDETADSQG